MSEEPAEAHVPPDLADSRHLGFDRVAEHQVDEADTRRAPPAERP